MRSMFRSSAYGRSYFLELCEFLRSYDKERIAAEHKPLDKELAIHRGVLEERYAKEIDQNEIIADELCKLVWVFVDKWTREACVRAKDEAEKTLIIRAYPKSASDRDEFIISIQQSFMQAQADRLRELIPNPFVPNIRL